MKLDSVFASARFPDGSNITFGDHTYCSPKILEPGKPYIEIEADVVFGSMEFVNESICSQAKEAIESTHNDCIKGSSS